MNADSASRNSVSALIPLSGFWRARLQPARGRNGRDLSQDHGAAGAGCGGEIGGPAAPGFVSEDGEGNRLFGVGVDAVVGGRGEAGFRQAGGEVAQDPRVVNSASRDDEVAGAVDKLPDGDGDGGGSEDGGGGDEIQRGRSRGAQPGDEGLAVLLASGALGRAAAVVRIAEEATEQGAVDFTPRGHAPAAVVPHLPAG